MPTPKIVVTVAGNPGPNDRLPVGDPLQFRLQVVHRSILTATGPHERAAG